MFPAFPVDSQEHLQYVFTDRGIRYEEGCDRTGTEEKHRQKEEHADNERKHKPKNKLEKTLNEFRNWVFPHIFPVKTRQGIFQN